MKEKTFKEFYMGIDEKKEPKTALLRKDSSSNIMI